MTELMVATVILSVGVLGLFGAFKYIARSTLISRATSMATNLGQERIESLKNLSYYALQITTATLTDSTVQPAIVYDTVNYPPETIAIGGITFTRYTFVGMAEMTGSDISTVTFNYPDTGLKQITVDIVWTEAARKKRWTLRNLLENPNINPLDSTITGTVTNSAGGFVASAVVVVEQNEDWGATTNASGAYTFSVYHGTYTIRVSSTGFTDGVSSSITGSRGETTTVPAISLTALATGYITGNAWYNTSLIISQVVAATETQVADGSTQFVEYIELFNPTTFPINIGTTGAAAKNVALFYQDETFAAGFGRWDLSGYGVANNLFVTNVTTYIAPGRYYLIANADSFYINGAWITADAYMDDNLTSPLAYPNYICNDKAGSISLYDAANGVWYDHVGWADNNNNPVYYEGNFIPDGGGINDGLGTPLGKQIVRVSSPGINASTLGNYGRAYDSNSNAHDFLYEGAYFNSFTHFVSPKSMASGAFAIVTGKVPTLFGTTYVSASDPNSGSTTAYTAYITSGALSLPYSHYQLAAVSTGTWSVVSAYSTYANSYENVVVTQNAYTGVPNAATTPAWAGPALSHIQLTSTTTSGFIKGTITNSALAPLSGITVQGGGVTKITGPNGVYFMPVSSGVITIIANPNNANASYVQSIEAPTVTAGAVVTQNFVLALGGRITGYVTTGTTPLAFQAVTAITGGGSQAGSAVTDASGNFTMRNVSTGTYTVFPVLESGQDTAPNTLPADLTSLGSVFVGTFTVAGAFGSITGTVTDAQGLVTSGALLLASTNTIASTPAAIVGSSAPAQVPIYMVSSKADGTYTLPVRGGSTYNLSAYVPVVTGSGVSITTKTYTGIAVSASAATVKHVTIP